jgi:DNA polymerase III epsilon subunit-like protein
MSAIIFDTETNGKPRAYNVTALQNVANWPRLVQLAYTDSCTGPIRTHVIRPDGWEIPDEVAAIHGLTTETATQQGVAVAPVLGELLVRLKAATAVVAHNADFDRNVLVGEYFRAFGRQTAQDVDSLNWVCTMKSTTDLVRMPGRYGYKWPTLTELYVALFREMPKVQTHRADGDVAILTRCYCELVLRRLQPEPLDILPKEHDAPASDRLARDLTEG